MTQSSFVAWQIWADGAAPSRFDLQLVRHGCPDLAALGIVVLYDNPKHALARSVVNCGDPRKALSDWTETAHLVLELQRKNHSKVKLVQRPLTSLDRTSRKQRLLDLFDGNALPLLSPEPSAEDESALGWAELALLASEDLRMLHDELLAATTGGGSDTPNVDAVLDRLWHQRDALRQRELLLSQVDELERHLKVGVVPEQLWQDIEDQKSRLAAETATLRAELAAEKNARKAVYASTSWRITGPLRGLSRLLKGRRRRSPRSAAQRDRN